MGRIGPWLNVQAGASGCLRALVPICLMGHSSALLLVPCPPASLSPAHLHSGSVAIPVCFLCVVQLSFLGRSLRFLPLKIKVFGFHAVFLKTILFIVN